MRSGRPEVRSAAGFGGPGIVYAATHASAQAARDALAEAGERVTLYHAGLSGRERVSTDVAQRLGDEPV